MGCLRHSACEGQLQIGKHRRLGDVGCSILAARSQTFLEAREKAYTGVQIYGREKKSLD